MYVSMILIAMMYTIKKSIALLVLQIPDKIME